MARDTLVIAPLVDEEYAQSEISSLVNILNAELLLGKDATSRNLLDKLISRQWKILWFICHGDQFGINLSDGPLESGILTSFIRGAKPEFVFLNSCSSLPVAMEVYNEVKVNFLCTVQEVPDQLSFFAGRQFAIALAKGSSYKDAYFASKPGQNQDFLFLSGDYPMTIAENNARDSNRILEGIENEIKRINALIEGNQKWNVIGMLDRIEQLNKDIEIIKGNIATIRLTMVLIFAISIFTLLAIISLIVKYNMI